MKNIIYLIILLVLSFSVHSCVTDDDDDPQPIELILGCTDEDSLNYDSSAQEDDGSCTYSDVTFYAKFNLFQNIPITKIDITIDGEFIGSINNGFIWPNGPGNCSSEGTIPFKFLNSNSIDWNATLFLSNGQSISTGGIKIPNRFSECIKVNVTN